MKNEVINFVIGEKGKRGWYIDHKKIPVAVSFTPNSGDLLLCLESLPCRFCLPGENVEFIELVKTSKSFHILVNYLGMKGTPDEYRSRLLIGNGYDQKLLDSAEKFVESLNSTFYR